VSITWQVDVVVVVDRGVCDSHVSHAHAGATVPRRSIAAAESYTSAINSAH
jgi:hypothetical protein